MITNSVRYTIGTALNRVLGTNTSVQVLVQGQWINGCVLDLDSDGVVLQSRPHHAVVRLADITAVQVESPTPPEVRQVAAATPDEDRDLLTT